MHDRHLYYLKQSNLLDWIWLEFTFLFQPQKAKTYFFYFPLAITLSVHKKFPSTLLLSLFLSAFSLFLVNHVCFRATIFFLFSSSVHIFSLPVLVGNISSILFGRVKGVNKESWIKSFVISLFNRYFVLSWNLWYLVESFDSLLLLLLKTCVCILCDKDKSHWYVIKRCQALIRPDKEVTKVNKKQVFKVNQHLDVVQKWVKTS